MTILQHTLHLAYRLIQSQKGRKALDGELQTCHAVRGVELDVLDGGAVVVVFHNDWPRGPQVGIAPPGRSACPPRTAGRSR